MSWHQIFHSLQINPTVWLILINSYRLRAESHLSMTSHRHPKHVWPACMRKNLIFSILFSLCMDMMKRRSVEWFLNSTVQFYSTGQGLLFNFDVMNIICLKNKWKFWITSPSCCSECKIEMFQEINLLRVWSFIILFSFTILVIYYSS